jgi:hypothetical protein
MMLVLTMNISMIINIFIYIIYIYMYIYICTTICILCIWEFIAVPLSPKWRGGVGEKHALQVVLQNGARTSTHTSAHSTLRHVAPSHRIVCQIKTSRSMKSRFGKSGDDQPYPHHHQIHDVIHIETRSDHSAIPRRFAACFLKSLSLR